MDANTHWYAVMTKPRAEAQAREHLERQGYRVLLPQIALRKRRRGVWAEVTEPLFPGYLFVALTEGVDDPAPIRSTVGCRGMVRSGHTPVPVPAAVMTPLLGLGDTPATEKTVLKPGDVVHIEAGPFAGLEAVFQMPKGADRAAVLVTILGSQRPVVVARDDLSCAP